METGMYTPLCGILFLSILFLALCFLAVYIYLKIIITMCNCDVDMHGKTVLITGGNSGIGKAVVEELAKRGARVILASRNVERGKVVAEGIAISTGNNNVLFKKMDLCSFSSVRSLAKDILKKEKRLDVLINNSGITTPSGEITEDGCEKLMQANHLGHFLLTMLLLDLLKKSAPSRIINVSSFLTPLFKLDLENLNSTVKDSAIAAYSRTKLANVLFTTELARRLEGTGVTANALNPGVVKTSIAEQNTDILGRFVKLGINIFGKTPFIGAQTIIHLAVCPRLSNVTGKFFVECKQRNIPWWAQDDVSARKLWQQSERLVGILPQSKD